MTTTTQTPLKVFGTHDEGTMEQINRCAESGVGAVLCADGHLGYSQPIGGAIAYDGYVSPSGVGYDIGCGNKAILTNLTVDDLTDPHHPFDTELPRLADEIFKRISFGVGRKNNEPVDHEVLDHIRDAPFQGQRALLDLAANQLGTVGAGNHYVDLFTDTTGAIWIGVHFGSRGFGHKTASGFLAMAQGKRFEEKGTEGEMHAPPTLFVEDSELGQAYISAMKLAGEYAYAGRDVVCERVLEILGAESIFEVHNHHNFAWKESHWINGENRDVWVVRKGCTPAFPGQWGFVGGSMGDNSVILQGEDTQESIEALYSTIHGAGRAMSRTKAAGKQGNAFVCTADRDCGYRVRPKAYQEARKAAGKENERFTLCPDHPDGRMKKQRVRWADGLINFDEVKLDLARRGIVLRGGAADEAPAAYKRLPEVLEEHEGTISVTHHLSPLVVVMAGAYEFDPYKD